MLEQNNATQRNSSSSGGGAATQAGSNFQNRIAAWIAVRILAEQDASPPWGLPVTGTLERLHCETAEPVDDLFVGTSTDDFVFIQAKHTVGLTTGPDSALASCLDQFVRQYIAYAGLFGESRTGRRALDPQRDRLVLISGPNSSAQIQRVLPSLLKKVRNLLPTQTNADAATNDQERNAWRAVQDHISRSWQQWVKEAPAESDIRKLVSFIRVDVLHVDADGADEREAKDILRRSVLRDPAQSDLAWNTLIQACAELASMRSQTDRRTLQKILLDAGIRIQAPRSYREDITRLQEYSRRTVALLSQNSAIQIGATQVKIARSSAEALRNGVEHGSFLVVGLPGSGKSIALHDLVRTLDQAESDVIFLSVDRLNAESLGALRTDINVSHDVPDILANWPGNTPAYLVLDALDAGKSDRSAQTLRDLMTLAMKTDSNRWRVIASIRKFDLRYDQELQQIFAGPPPNGEFRDPEFARLRHIEMPKLSDDELDQVVGQYQALAEVLSQAGQVLRELLRIPFNLRLLSELLNAGVQPRELTPIRTQTELLDRYWLRRVIGRDGQRGARETVLRRIAEGMVSARALRLDKAQVSLDGLMASALDDLLRSHVLMEWQPTPHSAVDDAALAFLHHVLFDYAVARLLLTGDPENIVNRLVSDPDLVLAIRPSLVFSFQRLWSSDANRAFLWQTVFRIIRHDAIPEIGKLIGPAVAAESATRMSDFDPLVAAIDSEDSDVRRAAEASLRHVIGALIADKNRSLLRPEAGLWYELLERISRSLQGAVVYLIRVLLLSLCEHPESFTADQRRHAGITGRRLLEFAWEQNPLEPWLVNDALEAVCRTYESDPAATEILLRRCLEPHHLAAYGHRDLPVLAREVKRLMPLNPKWVEDLYLAAFSYQENSQESTAMSNSRILALTSNRSQDYRGALSQLAEAYPDFLRQAPTFAVQALVAIIAASYSFRAADSTEETFDFNGIAAYIKADYSAIWDAGDTYRHDGPLQMLDAFGDFLKELSNDPERVRERRELVHILVTRNRLAALWRRLLLCGTAAPATLGSDLRSLAWTLPILRCIDTTTAAGDFLSAMYSTLAPHEREMIEHTILSIPATIAEGHQDAGEHMRDRLLGCLKSDLVTAEAQRRLRQLEATGGAPPNEPLIQPFNSWGAVRTATSDRELVSPIRVFADKYLNTSPTVKDILELLPLLRSLKEALSAPGSDAAQPERDKTAWGYLVEACERITHCEQLSGEDEAGAFVQAILLEAAEDPEPQPRPEYDAQFDEGPSWGGPSPRISAAAGLTLMARLESCATQAILEAVERLSSDPVPAVRFQVAERLICLYYTAPDLMWALLERLSHSEESRGVLQGMLTGTLTRIARSHPDRIVELARAIFNRITQGAGADLVRTACVSIFVQFYLLQDHPVCHEIVFALADDPGQFANENWSMAANLREALTYGSIAQPNPEHEALRFRAWALMERILRSTHAATLKLLSQNTSTPLAEDEQKRLRGLARLVDSMGHDLYAASGASDAKHIRSVEEKKRFLSEAGPLLDELTEFNYPSLIHRLLEMFDFLAPVDPPSVFLRIGRIVLTGRQNGYQYESFGADLIIRIVERYLAEFRGVLRENGEYRRILIEILDIFVKVGWPQARQLTYRMEEIFR